MKKLSLIAAAALITANIALAHAPRPGPNGGLMVDAANLHTELLVDGTETVKVFIFDAADKPIESAGYKANAILVIDGKPARFTLDPAGQNLMTGKAPGAVATGVKGAIQITAPDGSTIQAKY
jgi:hypothetical protein